MKHFPPTNTPLYAFTGGGTAGHLNPSLAVADTLKSLDPEASWYYVASRSGQESQILADRKDRYFVVEAAPIPLRRRAWPYFVMSNTKGYEEARKIFRQNRPKALFATGGFAAGPAALAALSLKIPLVIHEQNAYPGRLNRYLGPYAHTVCLAMGKAAGYFPKGTRLVETGNPVRAEFFDQDRKAARAKLGLQASDILVIALGGSRGAQAITESVIGLQTLPAWHDFLVKLRAQGRFLKLVLGTGRVNGGPGQACLDFQALADGRGDPLPFDLKLLPYLATTEYFPAADLFVGRSGATTCCELAASGLPAIFIPFPQAVANHQLYNARFYAEGGGAWVLEEKDLDPASLTRLMNELLMDPVALDQPRASMRDLAVEDAARRCVQILQEAGEGPARPGSAPLAPFGSGSSHGI